MRKDEKTGEMYDGWSSKFDEYINFYSHKIQRHMTRCGRAENNFDDEVDEDLDDLIAPEEGHERVYAVPRISSCISAKFISLMNRFAHAGGYDAILDVLENKTPDD